MAHALKQAIEQFKDAYLGKYGVVGAGEGENSIDVLLDDANEWGKIENPFLGYPVNMVTRSEVKRREKGRK